MAAHQGVHYSPTTTLSVIADSHPLLTTLVDLSFEKKDIQISSVKQLVRNQKSLDEKMPNPTNQVSCHRPPMDPLSSKNTLSTTSCPAPLLPRSIVKPMISSPNQFEISKEQDTDPNLVNQIIQMVLTKFQKHVQQQLKRIWQASEDNQLGSNFVVVILDASWWNIRASLMKLAPCHTQILCTSLFQWHRRQCLELIQSLEHRNQSLSNKVLTHKHSQIMLESMLKLAINLFFSSSLECLLSVLNRVDMISNTLHPNLIKDIEKMAKLAFNWPKITTISKLGLEQEYVNSHEEKNTSLFPSAFFKIAKTINHPSYVTCHVNPYLSPESNNIKSNQSIEELPPTMSSKVGPIEKVEKTTKNSVEFNPSSHFYKYSKTIPFDAISNTSISSPFPINLISSINNQVYQLPDIFLSSVEAEEYDREQCAKILAYLSNASFDAILDRIQQLVSQFPIRSKKSIQVIHILKKFKINLFTELDEQKSCRLMQMAYKFWHQSIKTEVKLVWSQLILQWIEKWHIFYTTTVYNHSLSSNESLKWSHQMAIRWNEMIQNFLSKKSFGSKKTKIKDRKLVLLGVTFLSLLPRAEFFDQSHNWISGIVASLSDVKTRWIGIKCLIILLKKHWMLNPIGGCDIHAHLETTSLLQIAANAIHYYASTWKKVQEKSEGIVEMRKSVLIEKLEQEEWKKFILSQFNDSISNPAISSIWSNSCWNTLDIIVDLIQIMANYDLTSIVENVLLKWIQAEDYQDIISASGRTLLQRDSKYTSKNPNLNQMTKKGKLTETSKSLKSEESSINNSNTGSIKMDNIGPFPISNTMSNANFQLEQALISCRIILSLNLASNSPPRSSTILMGELENRVEKVESLMFEMDSSMEKMENGEPKSNKDHFQMDKDQNNSHYSGGNETIRIRRCENKKDVNHIDEELDQVGWASKSSSIGNSLDGMDKQGSIVSDRQAKGDEWPPWWHLSKNDSQVEKKSDCKKMDPYILVDDQQPSSCSSQSTIPTYYTLDQLHNEMVSIYAKKRHDLVHVVNTDMKQDLLWLPSSPTLLQLFLLEKDQWMVFEHERKEYHNWVQRQRVTMDFLSQFDLSSSSILNSIGQNEKIKMGPLGRRDQIEMDHIHGDKNDLHRWKRWKRHYLAYCPPPLIWGKSLNLIGLAQLHLLQVLDSGMQLPPIGLVGVQENIHYVGNDGSLKHAMSSGSTTSGQITSSSNSQGSNSPKDSSLITILIQLLHLNLAYNPGWTNQKLAQCLAKSTLYEYHSTDHQCRHQIQHVIQVILSHDQKFAKSMIIEWCHLIQDFAYHQPWPIYKNSSCNSASSKKTTITKNQVSFEMDPKKGQLRFNLQQMIITYLLNTIKSWIKQIQFDQDQLVDDHIYQFQIIERKRSNDWDLNADANQVVPIQMVQSISLFSLLYPSQIIHQLVFKVLYYIKKCYLIFNRYQDSRRRIDQRNNMQNLQEKIITTKKSTRSNQVDGPHSNLPTGSSPLNDGYLDVIIHPATPDSIFDEDDEQEFIEDDHDLDSIPSEEDREGYLENLSLPSHLEKTNNPLFIWDQLSAIQLTLDDLNGWNNIPDQVIFPSGCHSISLIEFLTNDQWAQDPIWWTCAIGAMTKRLSFEVKKESPEFEVVQRLPLSTLWQTMELVVTGLRQLAPEEAKICTNLSCTPYSFQPNALFLCWRNNLVFSCAASSYSYEVPNSWTPGEIFKMVIPYLSSPIELVSDAAILALQATKKKCMVELTIQSRNYAMAASTTSYPIESKKLNTINSNHLNRESSQSKITKINSENLSLFPPTTMIHDQGKLFRSPISPLVPTILNTISEKLGHVALIYSSMIKNYSNSSSFDEERWEDDFSIKAMQSITSIILFAVELNIALDREERLLQHASIRLSYCKLVNSLANWWNRRRLEILNRPTMNQIDLGLITNGIHFEDLFHGWNHMAINQLLDWCSRTSEQEIGRRQEAQQLAKMRDTEKRAACVSNWTNQLHQIHMASFRALSHCLEVSPYHGNQIDPFIKSTWWKNSEEVSTLSLVEILEKLILRMASSNEGVKPISNGSSNEIGSSATSTPLSIPRTTNPSSKFYDYDHTLPETYLFGLNPTTNPSYNPQDQLETFYHRDGETQTSNWRNHQLEKLACQALESFLSSNLYDLNVQSMALRRCYEIDPICESLKRTYLKGVIQTLANRDLIDQFNLISSKGTLMKPLYFSPVIMHLVLYLLGQTDLSLRQVAHKWLQTHANHLGIQVFPQEHVMIFSHGGLIASECFLQVQLGVSKQLATAVSKIKRNNDMIEMKDEMDVNQENVQPKSCPNNDSSPYAEMLDEFLARVAWLHPPSQRQMLGCLAPWMKNIIEEDMSQEKIQNVVIKLLGLTWRYQSRFPMELASCWHSLLHFDRTKNQLCRLVQVMEQLARCIQHFESNESTIRLIHLIMTHIAFPSNRAQVIECSLRLFCQNVENQCKTRSGNSTGAEWIKEEQDDKSSLFWKEGKFNDLINNVLENKVNMSSSTFPIPSGEGRMLKRSVSLLKPNPGLPSNSSMIANFPPARSISYNQLIPNGGENWINSMTSSIGANTRIRSYGRKGGGERKDERGYRRRLYHRSKRAKSHMIQLSTCWCGAAADIHDCPACRMIPLLDINASKTAPLSSSYCEPDEEESLKTSLDQMFEWIDATNIIEQNQYPSRKSISTPIHGSSPNFTVPYQLLPNCDFWLDDQLELHQQWTHFDIDQKPTSQIYLSKWYSNQFTPNIEIQNASRRFASGKQPLTLIEFWIVLLSQLSCFSIHHFFCHQLPILIQVVLLNLYEAQDYVYQHARLLLSNIVIATSFQNVQSNHSKDDDIGRRRERELSSQNIEWAMHCWEKMDLIRKHKKIHRLSSNIFHPSDIIRRQCDQINLNLNQPGGISLPPSVSSWKKLFGKLVQLVAKVLNHLSDGENQHQISNSPNGFAFNSNEKTSLDYNQVTLNESMIKRWRHEALAWACDRFPISPITDIQHCFFILRAIQIPLDLEVLQILLKSLCKSLKNWIRSKEWLHGTSSESKFDAITHQIQKWKPSQDLSSSMMASPQYNIVNNRSPNDGHGNVDEGQSSSTRMKRNINLRKEKDGIQMQSKSNFSNQNKTLSTAPNMNNDSNLEIPPLPPSLPSILKMNESNETIYQQAQMAMWQDEEQLKLGQQYEEKIIQILLTINSMIQYYSPSSAYWSTGQGRQIQEMLLWISFAMLQSNQGHFYYLAIHLVQQLSLILSPIWDDMVASNLNNAMKMKIDIKIGAHEAIVEKIRWKPIESIWLLLITRGWIHDSYSSSLMNIIDDDSFIEKSDDRMIAFKDPMQQSTVEIILLWIRPLIMIKAETSRLTQIQQSRLFYLILIISPFLAQQLEPIKGCNDHDYGLWKKNHSCLYLWDDNASPSISNSSCKFKREATVCSISKRNSYQLAIQIAMALLEATQYHHLDRLSQIFQVYINGQYSEHSGYFIQKIQSELLVLLDQEPLIILGTQNQWWWWCWQSNFQPSPINQDREMNKNRPNAHPFSSTSTPTSIPTSCCQPLKLTFHFENALETLFEILMVGPQGWQNHVLMMIHTMFIDKRHHQNQVNPIIQSQWIQFLMEKMDHPSAQDVLNDLIHLYPSTSTQYRGRGCFNGCNGCNNRLQHSPVEDDENLDEWIIMSHQQGADIAAISSIYDLRPSLWFTEEQEEKLRKQSIEENGLTFIQSSYCDRVKINPTVASNKISLFLLSQLEVKHQLVHICHPKYKELNTETMVDVNFESREKRELNPINRDSKKWISVTDWSKSQTNPWERICHIGFHMPSYDNQTSLLLNNSIDSTLSDTILSIEREERGNELSIDQKLNLENIQKRVQKSLKKAPQERVGREKDQTSVGHVQEGGDWVESSGGNDRSDKDCNGRGNEEDGSSTSKREQDERDQNEDRGKQPIHIDMPLVQHSFCNFPEFKGFDDIMAKLH